MTTRISSTEQQLRGDDGETLALQHLQRHGLTLVERNFRCKGGELDLIMRAGDVLVFVEVRRRAAGRHGNAADSITRSKQQRLVIAAQNYLQRYRHPPACRFDVVGIDDAVITWLINAFDA